MDTKPIFDFLNELEFRTRYQRPSADADRSALGKSKGDYYKVLRMMEREFEACLFQCMAEDSSFKVDVIVSKLFDCCGDLVEFRNRVPLPFGVDREVALAVARESALSLEKQGLINPVTGAIKTTVDGIPVDVSKIDWSKPVYTADEVKKLLGVSDTTFRRWMNAGWITYSQMDGSDKRFIQREHLMEFLNNPKVLYPSTK